MDYRLKQLQRETEETIFQSEQVIQLNARQSENLDRKLEQVGHEYGRVYDIDVNAHQVIEDIDQAFIEKTKLSGTDVTLLFLCTAIQCARQYLLQNDAFRLEAVDGDKLTKAPVKNVLSWAKKCTDNPQAKDKTTFYKKDKTTFYKDFLTSPVPYDAVHSNGLVTGISGTTHRYRTAAHDPVLGWIFGPVNILSNSLTKSDIITTYLVQGNTMVAYYPLGTPGAIMDAVSVVKNNPEMLLLALMKQMIHFGSDFFTKQGLPLPLLGTLSPEMAHKFMFTKFKNCPQIDSFSVGRQAAIAALINQLIYYIHQLFYRGDIDGTPSMYEVRTRKILSYSNALATGSNVIVVALTRDMKKLDVGGMLVTIHRLISDNKFIQEVKRDFLKNEIYKMVVGAPYDFMEVDKNV